MTDGWTPLIIFASSFGIAALSGLAALLRSPANELTALRITSSVLNSGLLGLGISLLWYIQLQENLYFLVGVCAIAGLGGMTTLDFILGLIRKGGFTIQVGNNKVEFPDKVDKNDNDK